MRFLILKNPDFLKRAIEITLPLTTWAIITSPVWLSPFHPAFVAYFILTFDIYFFYKSLTLTIFSTISYYKLKKLSCIDWSEKAHKITDFSKIHQAIIIPNYKESFAKLCITLDYIAKQDFPKKRIVIILAMEGREGNDAKIRANLLIRKYQKVFGYIKATFHPDITGEVKGKASNSAWAAKYLSKFISEKNIDKDYVIVTSCDADSLLPEKYFSYLTFSFLTDPNRYFHFYWAPVLLYSNFWEVPLPIRLQATMSSIIRLAGLSRPDTLIQISTYSFSLSI